MARKILALVILGFFAVSVGAVSAAEKKSAPKAEPAKKTATLDIANIQAKTVVALNAQGWGVALLPLKATPAAKSQQSDVLTFVGNSVISQMLNAKGFYPSNYAVNVQADGSSVLESMQRADNGDIATLRLTLSGDTLMGTIMVRPKSGAVEGYYFNGASKLALAPPPAPPTPPAETPAPVQEKAEAQKAKR